MDSSGFYLEMSYEVHDNRKTSNTVPTFNV